MLTSSSTGNDSHPPPVKEGAGEEEKEEEEPITTTITPIGICPTAYPGRPTIKTDFPPLLLLFLFFLQDSSVIKALLHYNHHSHHVQHDFDSATALIKRKLPVACVRPHFSHLALLCTSLALFSLSSPLSLSIHASHSVRS